MTKMTYVQALDIAINALTGSEGEVVDRLIALRASIEKKNSADKKPTKTQLANADIRNEILALLSDGVSRTISEIAEAIPALHDATSQRVSALLTPLMKDETIVREMVKRKAYFKMA